MQSFEKIRSNIKSLGVGFFLLAMALLSTGCYHGAYDTAPSVLRIGVLPDDEDAALQHRYALLINHLTSELNLEVELVIPANYQTLVDMFGMGQLDAAYFGGTTFVAANMRHGAVPLVMRDVDVELSTYFIARHDSPAAGIESFKGQRFIFGSRFSTAGHLMPRFFMHEIGIDPEIYFTNIDYAGTDEKTIENVLNGSANIGSVAAEAVDAMLNDGRLEPGQLRIIWETPPYASHIWAVRADLGNGFTNRLRDAFLALSPADPKNAEILARMGSGGFLPAQSRDFDRLRMIMTQLPQFRSMTRTAG